MSQPLRQAQSSGTVEAMPRRLINSRPSKDTVYDAQSISGSGGSEPVPRQGIIDSVNFADNALHSLASVTVAAGPEGFSLITLSVPYSVSTAGGGGSIQFTILIDGVPGDQVTVDVEPSLDSFRDIYERSFLTTVSPGSHVYSSSIQGTGVIAASITGALPISGARLIVTSF